MKQWFALEREDEMRFFHDDAVEDEPAETDEPTEVSSVLVGTDDAASETDTQDGSIEKVTEAQECNGLSEQDVTVLREKWNCNEMEKKKKKNKCFEFLKHFWKPMSIMVWLAILIEALQFGWMDLAVLCTLQAINGLFSWYEESKVSDAIEATRKNLAPKCNVKRTAEWFNMASGNLVPRNLVKLNSMD